MASHAFASPPHERAVAHGPTEILELERQDLERASGQNPGLAMLLLGQVTTRARFMQQRLGWQFTTPIRCRVAAALRDLICFAGQRCRHGHSIDVRLTHQDLADLIGAARPVVSAELSKLRSEGLVSSSRLYFCVDDLAGLARVAEGDEDA